MANTLKFGNGEWYGKKDTILAYNDENNNYKPLPFDFSRASKATVVNKDGLIEVVGNNEPRVDFSNDANGALLLEPSRSNSLNFSEPTSSETIATGITYESFNWNLGFTNCIKFGDNSQTRYRYFTGSIANSTEYTISAFVIMDDLSEPVLGTGSDTGDLIFRVGGQSATTGNLPNVNMGNNIYRLSSVITSASGGGSTGLLKYSNQSNKGFRIVGFQVEQGSYATSYIPTSGSAVTRLADACNNGANEQVINSTEGVLYWECSALSDDVGATRVLSISNGSSADSLYTGYNSSSNAIQAQLVVGGVAQTNMLYTVSDRTNFIKVAILYQNNNHKMYVNGVQVSVDTNGSVPSANTFDRLNFDLGQGSFDFFGSVKDLKLYNTALTDNELQALTQV
jgi:hypothetical protein